jgi:DNA polymerase-3 subunit gamma/tau
MHITLYRKHRPEKFEDVVGQDHIVEPLKSAIAKKTINHAYLFHGTRGTGKTTIARIFARELGVSKNDLYEMDAASNRNIDDIRELREAVKTFPFESDKKVYIMDEVHMLTKDAWNALLKTLEEPPEHVVFILATTELHKIPETIISRCEVHSFKQPDKKVLAGVVENVAKKEGYKISPQNAELVALSGEGSFRDTLGMLQKVLNVTEGKEIKESDIEQGTGIPSKKNIRDFVSAYVKKDTEKALKSFENSINDHLDTKNFLDMVLHIVRMALLLKISKNSTDFVRGQLSEEDFSFVESLLKNESENINSKTVLNLLEGYKIFSLSPVKELAVEILVSNLE